ncbi:MAG: TMEM175 family protein, partial [Acidimicrobiales bacterium]
MSKARLESFSDAIFAIAITVLVLNIAGPTNFHDLGHQLVDRVSDFAAYIVSFAVIGIMWLNHHLLFSHFSNSDRGLVLCNLALMLTIAFLPYPTSVFGRALVQGSGTKVAAVFYSVTMAVNAYMWAVLWLYASVNRRLLVPAFPESQRAVATVLFTAGTVAYTLAVGVGFLSPVASLALQGAFCHLLRPRPGIAPSLPGSVTVGVRAGGRRVADRVILSLPVEPLRTHVE